MPFRAAAADDVADFELPADGELGEGEPGEADDDAPGLADVDAPGLADDDPPGLGDDDAPAFADGGDEGALPLPDDGVLCERALVVPAPDVVGGLLDELAATTKIVPCMNGWIWQ